MKIKQRKPKPTIAQAAGNNGLITADEVLGVNGQRQGHDSHIGRSKKKISRTTKFINTKFYMEIAQISHTKKIISKSTFDQRYHQSRNQQKNQNSRLFAWGPKRYNMPTCDILKSTHTYTQ